MAWGDQLVLEWLAPLSLWILLNGVDDLFVDCARLGLWLWELRRPAAPPPLEREPRAALLIPCWREADVIEQMLERNLAALRYENYDIWLGLYPNDPESIERVRRCAARHPRVRYVVGPRPGPTTKADCLNQAIEGVLAHEERSGEYYELFLQHDAEDVIHPLALEQAARWTRTYDMVQLPVFAWPTPLRDWTHGVYCDDFADVHQRELPVRWRLGGFVPSAGVGTALRREAVDQLRISYGRQVFDPSSLTEDYFLGLRLRQLGFSQAFAFERGQDGRPIATRAYFPQTLRSAIRQRTRWTIGNVLQSWERFGWRRGQLYWLWRDRKGLFNNPAALAANAVFCWGAWSWLRDAAHGQPWALGAAISGRTGLEEALAATAALLVWRQGARIWWSGRLYGWRFAAAAPLRAVWANGLNVAAAARAGLIFCGAKLRRRPLHWSKTQHAYPQEAPGGGAREPRLDPRAAALVRWEQAQRVGATPWRLEGETLVLAQPAPPTLAAERQARKLLRRANLRLVQVSEVQMAALRRQHRELGGGPLAPSASLRESS
ncbi:MAG: glycosyltransferase [Acidobacteria bacterium]|nr:glycosyltransferase [Acidobacteriota bacterium]